MKLKKINKLIYCECGCRNILEKFDKKGRIRTFIHGHNRRGKMHENSKNTTFIKGRIVSQEICDKISIGNKGRKVSLETRKKISIANKGTKNKQLFGKNNPAWKGGITGFCISIRRLKKYYDWRYEVFKRDDFICQNCKIRSYRLNAHHIKTFSDIILENNIKTVIDGINCEELWYLSNGITLCKDCHIIIHKIERIKNGIKKR